MGQAPRLLLLQRSEGDSGKKKRTRPERGWLAGWLAGARRREKDGQQLVTFHLSCGDGKYLPMLIANGAGEQFLGARLLVCR